MTFKLLCTVTIENTKSTNGNRNSMKNAELFLSRNNFKDIILNLQHKKTSSKYVLKDLKTYTRFVNEGKSTLCLPMQGIQIMISNSPPHQLKSFLGFLTIKTTKDEANKENKPVKIRSRMLAEKEISTNEISPINDAEIAMARAQHNLKRKNVDQTPIKSTEKINRKKLCIDGKPTSTRMSLTSEQSQVVNAVLEGHSIFYTGCAGTGKSYLLKYIISRLPPDSTYATASTAAAASYISGTTLHGFAGIGTGKNSLPECVATVRQNRQTLQHWRKCKCLIIDEISMVDGNFFDKLEHIARMVRENNKPFGGIQLILCGDFLQLPPVTKQGEKKVFAFQGKSWDTSVKFCFELTAVKRQTDSEFIEALKHVRLGRCPQMVEEIFKKSAQQTIEGYGISGTKLCTHTDQVDIINKREIQKLTGNTMAFVAEDSEPSLSKMLDSQCRAVQRLELKVGTQVMLNKNIDIQKGLVNGARGVVVAFEKETGGSKVLPVVKFIGGLQRSIGYEKWTMRLMNGATISRQQIPLKLAWAMSIHKSQGMTLDCVEISLGRVFECGQAYVALSRASSLKGLRVTDFSPACIQANQDVLKFYRGLSFSKLKVQSRLLPRT